MKIRLDEVNQEIPEAGLFLESDGIQFILRKYTKKNEKGETPYNTIGYYSTVAVALNKVVNLKIALSEAKTIGELRKEVNEIREWLNEQINF